LLNDLPAGASGCLLLDLDSRRTNPLGLLKAVRRHGTAAPAIILTDSPLASATEMNAGATILQKPVSAEDLVGSVVAALGHRSAA
jgi:FixJ family two-component response regulator